VVGGRWSVVGQLPECGRGRQRRRKRDQPPSQQRIADERCHQRRKQMVNWWVVDDHIGRSAWIAIEPPDRHAGAQQVDVRQQRSLAIVERIGVAQQMRAMDGKEHQLGGDDQREQRDGAPRRATQQCPEAVSGMCRRCDGCPSHEYDVSLCRTSCAMIRDWSERRKHVPCAAPRNQVH
jgi:hypothetical protein